ncbi:MAG: sensor histidine kinase [Anaerolineae bacterium]
MSVRDVIRHAALDEEDAALLEMIAGDLPILADISRSDVQLLCRAGSGLAVVVAQAGPHSVKPIYGTNRVGTTVTAHTNPEVIRALATKPNPSIVYTLDIGGGTVARQVFPVRSAKGLLIAVLAKDSYWLTHERQKHRAKVFQRAIVDFIAMVLRGELIDGDSLTSFGEHDGIVYIGADRSVLYMSGVASGLYRHLGYRDSMVGHRINELSIHDQQLFNQVASEQHCIERQDEQDGLTWVRKALPLYRLSATKWNRTRFWQRKPATRLHGVLILVHDATEAVQSQREIESKMALICEVHHRVKNNLQIIASLMRMQARRVTSDEAREVLHESVNRVLSVAVVHEFLSQNATGTINLQDVAHRILSQMQQGLIDPSKHIQLNVKGDAIWLPAERATQCALVINELVQNALEHGLEHRDQGIVNVELVDLGDQVQILVSDNGEGLPEGFQLSTSSNLGLRIVSNLVERDLRGKFDLLSEAGTRAVVIFAKSVLGG